MFTKATLFSLLTSASAVFASNLEPTCSNNPQVTKSDAQAIANKFLESETMANPPNLCKGTADGTLLVGTQSATVYGTTVNGVDEASTHWYVPAHEVLPGV